ncbi:hypothetical protein FGO68_gene9154 [Halteria grandinella]|uniref:Uncharacterized protein n=1 Tax=Halteria grandinella TaxID=5974 RepID=A0A8J8NCT1_HALGN|nr:hypothetical protein FGO68_gene9154 [Halteria grandinella]
MKGKTSLYHLGNSGKVETSKWLQVACRLQSSFLSGVQVLQLKAQSNILKIINYNLKLNVRPNGLEPRCRWKRQLSRRAHQPCSTDAHPDAAALPEHERHHHQPH